jgi:hypothetical protein
MLGGDVAMIKVYDEIVRSDLGRPDGPDLALIGKIFSKQATVDAIKRYARTNNPSGQGQFFHDTRAIR